MIGVGAVYRFAGSRQIATVPRICNLQRSRAEEHFQSMVKAALMALFDDPQVQQRVVLMLRNRIRSEPFLLR